MSGVPSSEEDISRIAETGGGVVIIQTAFPGDVILTGGLVCSLRDALPDTPLAIVVRPDCEPLARMMDRKLEVIVYDKRGADRGSSGLRKMAKHLAAGPWRAALIPHRSLRSALLARQAGLYPRIGFDLGIQSLLYTRSVPYRRGIHEVERNYDLLRFLATESDREGEFSLPLTGISLKIPSMQIPPDGIREAELVLERLADGSEQVPFAAMAPGSVWSTKRWPAEYWAYLAKWFSEAGLGVIWLGGNEERELCDRTAHESGTGVVAAGELTWNGTAALLERASLLVANDTAAVHMAGALDCPVLVLFGPTVPGFGFGPMGKRGVAVGMRIGCRPCRLHGSRKCPEGHFRCMRDLQPAAILKTAICLLEDRATVR